MEGDPVQPSEIRTKVLDALRFNSVCNLTLGRKLSADGKKTFITVSAPRWDKDWDHAYR